MVTRSRVTSRLAFLVAAASAAGCSLVAGINDLEFAPAGDDGGGTDAVAADGSTADSPSGDDASSGDDTSVDGAIAFTVDPLSVYVGQTATLVSHVPVGTTGVTYAWTLDVVPLNSTLTTASLGQATTGAPTFVPDQVGTYALTGVATHQGAVEIAHVQVRAYEAPIFYLQAQTSPSTAAFVRAIGTLGTDAGALDCFLSTPQGPNETWGPRVGGAGADFWEGAPGTESRLALMYPDNDPDTGVNGISLIAISSKTSACSGARLRRDEGAPVPFIQPRLSPDGARIAYVRAVPGAAAVAAVGFDGQNPHLDVAPYFADADGGPVYDGSIPLAQPIPRRPSWKDTTHFGFVQQLAGRFQIALVTDQDQSPISVYMQCGLQTPSEFAFLPNGDVLASLYVPQVDGGQGAVDIVVLTPDPTTRQCSLVRNLTHGAPTASFTDFSLSPDGAQVAFAGFDPAINGSAPYVAAVDGSSAPVRLAGTVAAGSGPRWVAGGSLLAYGLSATSLRAIPPTAVKVFPPDAGVTDAGDAGDGGDADAAQPPFDAGPALERVLVQAKGTDHVYSFGNGVYTGCATSRGASGPLATLGGALAALGLLLARRRRK